MSEFKLKEDSAMEDLSPVAGSLEERFIEIIQASTIDRLKVEFLDLETRRYRIVLEGKLIQQKSAESSILSCASRAGTKSGAGRGEENGRDWSGRRSPSGPTPVPLQRKDHTIETRVISDRVAGRGQLIFREGESIMVRQGGPGSAIRMLVEQEPTYRVLYGDQRLESLRHPPSPKKESHPWIQALRELMA